MRTRSVYTHTAVAFYFAAFCWLRFTVCGCGSAILRCTARTHTFTATRFGSYTLPGCLTYLLTRGSAVIPVCVTPAVCLYHRFFAVLGCGYAYTATAHTFWFCVTHVAAFTHARSYGCYRFRLHVLVRSLPFALRSTAVYAFGCRSYVRFYATRYTVPQRGYRFGYYTVTHSYHFCRTVPVICGLRAHAFARTTLRLRTFTPQVHLRFTDFIRTLPLPPPYLPPVTFCRYRLFVQRTTRYLRGWFVGYILLVLHRLPFCRLRSVTRLPLLRSPGCRSGSVTTYRLRYCGCGCGCGLHALRTVPHSLRFTWIAPHVLRSPLQPYTQLRGYTFAVTVVLRTPVWFFYLVLHTLFFTWLRLFARYARCVLHMPRGSVRGSVTHIPAGCTGCRFVGLRLLLLVVVRTCGLRYTVYTVLRSAVVPARSSLPFYHVCCAVAVPTVHGYLPVYTVTTLRFALLHVLLHVTHTPVYLPPHTVTHAVGHIHARTYAHCCGCCHVTFPVAFYTTLRLHVHRLLWLRLRSRSPPLRSSRRLPPFTFGYLRFAFGYTHLPAFGLVWLGYPVTVYVHYTLLYIWSVLHYSCVLHILVLYGCPYIRHALLPVVACLVYRYYTGCTYVAVGCTLHTPRSLRALYRTHTRFTLPLYFTFGWVWIVPARLVTGYAFTDYTVHTTFCVHHRVHYATLHCYDIYHRRLPFLPRFGSRYALHVYGYFGFVHTRFTGWTHFVTWLLLQFTVGYAAFGYAHAVTFCYHVHTTGSLASWLQLPITDSVHAVHGWLRTTHYRLVTFCSARLPLPTFCGYTGYGCHTMPVTTPLPHVRVYTPRLRLPHTRLVTHFTTHHTRLRLRLVCTPRCRTYGWCLRLVTVCHTYHGWLLHTFYRLQRHLPPPRGSPTCRFILFTRVACHFGYVFTARVAWVLRYGLHHGYIAVATFTRYLRYGWFSSTTRWFWFVHTVPRFLLHLHTATIHLRVYTLRLRLFYTYVPRYVWFRLRLLVPPRVLPHTVVTVPAYRLHILTVLRFPHVLPGYLYYVTVTHAAVRFTGYAVTRAFAAVCLPRRGYFTVAVLPLRLPRYTTHVRGLPRLRTLPFPRYTLRYLPTHTVIY